MKNIIKLSLLGAAVAGVFSACSEPKSIEYYSDPKNAKELEAKLKECKKNANSAQTDTECANAYHVEYSKSFKKEPLDPSEFFKNAREQNKDFELK